MSWEWILYLGVLSWGYMGALVYLLMHDYHIVFLMNL